MRTHYTVIGTNNDPRRDMAPTNSKTLTFDVECIPVTLSPRQSV